MATDGRVQPTGDHTRHYFVEEEYTVRVPLVRPKPAFLKVLRLAGATGEVFTQKEICHLLKDYIGSRWMYDPQDPRIVNCGGDILGEVFGVKSFTIADVLHLLSKNCTVMPDTCLKRKRHLVAKPVPAHINSQIAPRQDSQILTSAPLLPATATSVDLKSSVPSTANGLPSLISPPESGHYLLQSVNANPVLHSDHHLTMPDSSKNECLKMHTDAKISSMPDIPYVNSRLYTEVSTGDIGSSTQAELRKGLQTIDSRLSKTNNNSGINIHETSESKSSKEPDTSVPKPPTYPAPSCSAHRKSSSSCSEGQSAIKESAESDHNQLEALSTTSSSVPLTGDKQSKHKGKKRKRNKKKDSKDGGPRRKRHHTEPGCSPQVALGTSNTTSSRRRGTSLSITYADGSEAGSYPWYFEVKVEDDDDNSNGEEVLSVQGRETMSVRDSSDDLWFLDEDSIHVEVDSDTEIAVEYDLESNHSHLSESDLSSIRSGQGFLVVCQESDVEFFADYSDTDSNMGDKELSEADYWACSECQHMNEPLLRYCSRCWKLRSNWLPSRTPSQRYLDRSAKMSKGVDTISPDPSSDKEYSFTNTKHQTDPVITDVKDTKGLIDSGFGSLSSTQETIGSQDSEKIFKPVVRKGLQPPSVADFDVNQKSFLQESQEVETRYSLLNFQMEKNKSSSSLDSSDNQQKNSVVPTAQTDPLHDPCIICLTKPKTASLVHGGSGHQVCCFECGKRMKRRGKKCPVCRRPIQKVIKNYIL